MCRSPKKISEVHQESVQDEQETDDVFLGAVGSKLQLNEKEIEFQIDTGAEADVILEQVNTRISSPSLLAITQTFRGPSKNVILIIERFMGKLSKDHIEVEQKIYVAKALHKPLLGQPAIEALGLLQQIQGIQLKKLDPVEQFPSLFCGLGKFKVIKL